MKKLLLLILSTALLFLNCFAQAPSIQWQKSLGGSDHDEGKSIFQTTDGGYIVAGKSTSHDGDISAHHTTTNNPDAWVVKLNSVGSIEWEKSFGGTDQDWVNSIVQTSDGGYIFAGITNSDDGDVTVDYGFYDCWVVKLDNVGSIVWQKSYGGTDQDAGESIIQTSDGGYIIAGSSLSDDFDVTDNHGSYDFWIIKINNSGAIVWQKSLGGTRYEVAESIQQTSDGGYIVAGQTRSLDGDVTGYHEGNNCLAGFCYDYWVVKIDNIGTIQWQKTLGGEQNEEAKSIQQTNDGGYIVTGFSGSNDGDVTGHHGSEGSNDFWVVKLNNIGNIQWEKSLGGTEHDNAESILQTSDGGYIVGGNSASNDGNVTGHHGNTWEFTDAWLVKLDNSGEIQWQQSFGGSISDRASSVIITNDNHYVFSGHTFSNDGDVSGHHGSTDYSDYWVVKLNNSGGTGIVENDVLFRLYPNPATNILTIETASGKGIYQLSDLSGKLILNGNANTQKFILDLSAYENGVYMLTLIGEEKNARMKIVKQ